MTTNQNSSRPERWNPTERELDLYWQLRNRGQFALANDVADGWDRGLMLSHIDAFGLPHMAQPAPPAPIRNGERVQVSHDLGYEAGTVLGSSANPDGSMRRYTIRFDDGTQSGWADWQVARISDDHGPGCDGPLNCTCPASGPETSEVEMARLQRLEQDGILRVLSAEESADLRLAEYLASPEHAEDRAAAAAAEAEENARPAQFRAESDGLAR